MAHRAFGRAGDGKVGVLCVHGIQGSPEQFRWLSEQLPEAVGFRAVLLPGHGGDVADFRRAGNAEWQMYVYDIAQQTAREFRRVIFVGHSMGCLLGLNAQWLYGSFSGMLLLACPLALHFTPRYIHHNWLAPMLGRSKNPFVRAATEANSVSARCPLEYMTAVHPYIELLKLIRECKGVMMEPRVAAAAVYSERDEIVSPRAMDVLREGTGIESVIAPGCGHDYYNEEGRDIIMELMEALIAGR